MLNLDKCVNISVRLAELGLGMAAVYTSQTVNCVVVVAVVLAWWLVYTAVTSEMATTEDTVEAANKSGH